MLNENNGTMGRGRRVVVDFKLRKIICVNVFGFGFDPDLNRMLAQWKDVSP